MCSLIMTSDLGPHRFGDGDRYLRPHRHRKVNKQRLGRQALVVRPQVAVVSHHVLPHELRHVLIPHLLL